MNIEALVLGLFSGLRPGTSLAAVLALLRTPQPRRPLVFFIVAGFAWTWVFGMLVVAIFHGADVAFGGSTFTAVLEVALGAAALGYATGLQAGWVQPVRLHNSRPQAPGAASRFSRHLHDPSPRVAAVAGVGTHLPGLIYLAALNAIASGDPGIVSAGVRVAIYDALWFMVPVAALVLVVVRPGAALTYLEQATAWVRRHEHGVLVAGLLALGCYLLVKGAVHILT